MTKLISIFILLGIFNNSYLYAVDVNEEWQSFTATYEVPVDEPDLAAYAHYEIPDIRLRERDGKLELKYELPAHLVGENLGSINFEGTPEDMRNEFGHASCHVQVCKLNYNKKLSDILTQRLPEVEKLLMRDFPAAELEQRMEVARRFAGDPIGIIIYFDKLFNYPLSQE